MPSPTEQASLSDTAPALAIVEQLWGAGVRFAFDDTGMAHSHLPLIDKLRPSFLKIGQQFGTLFGSEQTKTKIVMNIVSLARDFGAEVIIEGIEDRSTARAAADLDIHFGQGYLFGRPSDPFSGSTVAREVTH